MLATGKPSLLPHAPHAAQLTTTPIPPPFPIETLSHYLYAVRHYADTGQTISELDAVDDPVARWLTDLLAAGWWQQWLHDSPLCRAIFKQSVGRYVVQAFHQISFQRKRQFTARRRAEEVATLRTSLLRDAQGMHALFEEVARELAPFGFDANFFHRLYDAESDQALFLEKLSYDWTAALDEQAFHEVDQYLDRLSELIRREVEVVLRNATHRQTTSRISSSQALALWRLMDGRWDGSAWEHAIYQYKSHERYPQLADLVRRMGRKGSSEGSRRLTTGTTGTMLPRATGSDIEGISVGNELGAVLPGEWALYADRQMESLFWYKYSRRRLQTFRHMSRSAASGRTVSEHKARSGGPIVVCIDTSASMRMAPAAITRSLLMLLEQQAESEGRACYMIDFSVSTRAIDLGQRRREKEARQMGLSDTEFDFSKGELPFLGQGTNAKAMLQLLFDVLDDHHRPYAQADVLIVSDFIMALPAQEHQQQIASMRRTGTRFYALELHYTDTVATASPYRQHEHRPDEVDAWKRLLHDGWWRIDYRPLHKY